MSIKQLLESGGNLNDVGKLMDPRVNKFGPTDPGDEVPKDLTPRQRSEWNAYVDWLDTKGYKGSPLLDKKATGLASGLFEQFKKENPDVTLTYENISQVQTEMQKLRENVQAFEKRRGAKDADTLMSGISQVDGWPGSKTTSFKFPSMTIQEFRNNELVTKKNLGIVDYNFKPSESTATKKKLPKGVKLETMSDGRKYYEDPESGNMVLYE